MVERHCVACFYVELRPEAAKLRIPENSFRNMVIAFRDLPRVKALKVLFRFYYGTLSQRKETLTWFKHQQSRNFEKVIVEEDYLNTILRFSDKEFRILADELLYQYKQSDPSFLNIEDIKDLPSCQKELDELCEVMNGHPVLIFRVVEKCAKSYKKNEIVSDCLPLFLSKNPTSQNVALERLGLKFEYRILIRPFARNVGKLLSAMHKTYIDQQKLLAIKDALTTPLVDLLNQMKHLQSEIYPELTDSNQFNEISIYENKLMKFIRFSSVITADSSYFDDLTKYQEKLMRLGLAIITLLQKTFELQNVKEELKDSNTEYSGQKNEGILFAAVTNISLIPKLSNAENSHKDAKHEYSLAYQDLQNFLETQ